MFNYSQFCSFSGSENTWWQGVIAVSWKSSFANARTSSRHNRKNLRCLSNETSINVGNTPKTDRYTGFIMKAKHTCSWAKETIKKNKNCHDKSSPKWFYLVSCCYPRNDLDVQWNMRGIVMCEFIEQECRQIRETEEVNTHTHMGGLNRVV
jgi:hypothetical protein